MEIQELRSKNIAILGMGVNNRALAAYLLRHGASVTLRDAKAGVKTAFEEAYPEFTDNPACTWEIRPGILDELQSFDILFRSPSIWVHSPELQAFKAHGTVYSQTKLFFDLCPATIVGITGSKGKGTTASLVYRMLDKGYQKGKAYVAGNIGVDPFEFLDELTQNDVVVLELSSFQLQDLEASPHVAVVLKITPDHLDHHASFEEYRDAKLQLIAHQKAGDVAVLWGENPDLELYKGKTDASVLTYSRHTPQTVGGWEAEEVVRIVHDGREWNVPIDGRRIPGDHNLENIVPACIVGTVFDIPEAVLQEAAVTFPGLPHRLHKVGEWEGVELYDDSIATTPESCQVAMEAFPNRRLHLIMGGRDKGQDYAALAPLLGERCGSIGLLPGPGTAKLRLTLQPYQDKLRLIEPAGEPIMESILADMKETVNPGDVILLAPAAASDQPYGTYVRRAASFTQAVEAVFGITVEA